MVLQMSKKLFSHLCQMAFASCYKTINFFFASFETTNSNENAENFNHNCYVCSLQTPDLK